jgi:exosortase
MTTATRDEPRDQAQSPDKVEQPSRHSRSKAKRSAPTYGPLDPNSYPGYSIGAIGLMATFFWAYWPTLVSLVDAWDSEPDYSHGYFVVPLAIVFLWVRWESFPGIRSQLSWPGLILIAASIGVRFAGARFYIGSIDGWSMLLWLAGVVWLFGGTRLLAWSGPSIGFLFFMIPLPWKVETWARVPLQKVATNLSVWVLQLLGQPAMAEGHTILINDMPLEVADECSGLRIFMGIVALAFAYLILVKRSWWERGLLLVSVVPIALIANSARIVGTAYLNQIFPSEAAHQRIHDWSGLVMIPFAALLFGLVLWYLGKLIREMEVVSVGSVARGKVR